MLYLDDIVNIIIINNYKCNIKVKDTLCVSNLTMTCLSLN